MCLATGDETIAMFFFLKSVKNSQVVKAVMPIALLMVISVVAEVDIIRLPLVAAVVR